MLEDRRGLDVIARDLRDLYRTPPGVAERMLDAMAASLTTAASAAPDARVKAGAASA
jgi:hypothetical protein